MACVENIPPRNADSEMEEGEIVDDLDDLSDISSDEEFLLRQRLHVLETYNNVLERKKANSISIGSDLDDNNTNLKKISNNKHPKSHSKQKRKKEFSPIRISTRNKEYKKKSHRKKKLQTKVISETSEESDDEYRNKRRKLANAVSINKIKNDTSLSTRLKKMLHNSQDLEPLRFIESNEIEANSNFKTVEDNLVNSPLYKETYKSSSLINEVQKDFVKNAVEICELIDLSNDDDIKSNPMQDTIDSAVAEKNVEHNNEKTVGDSDEDLELLRQHALKTKSTKVKVSQSEIEPENKLLSEDDDTYTAELRLICLKSAYLKKAIEIKRKQKLKKRLSQSSILQDDIITGEDILSNQIESQNNTDIESVDMDIGSDGDEKIKELGIDSAKLNTENEVNCDSNDDKHIIIKSKEDELDEDEDLLRAKLLTSLSKNLPNLINSNIINTIEEAAQENKAISTDKQQITSVSEQKRFIIKLGESDSEGEHEATKNLTKMHMKQQQSDFEQQLDMFLKFTRMKVENQENPSTQLSAPVKPSEKFVAKSVKNLPKSEQLEYKNLVKRMAELEKIKKARQSSMNLVNKDKVLLKETLKPHNVSMDTINTSSNIDEQIALSRKKIAEESANMLRLKEEATKLSQKYKIVATELRNITTAITLNKKQQRVAQNRLSKIRLHHQALLKSSNFKHSKKNGIGVDMSRAINKNNTANKVQKENNPTKEDYKNPQLLKSVKVSVVNDLKDTTVLNPRLSVQVDITNNKKVVRMPNSPVKNTSDLANTFDNEAISIEKQNVSEENDNNICQRVDKSTERRNSREIVNDTSQGNRRKKKDADDYISPLDIGNWKEDPNAFLCPFEIGGSCKDTDCTNLHLNRLSGQ